ncbi:hypothetical protein BJX96DRAFT_161377 [Aspergillus floccosus]
MYTRCRLLLVMWLLIEIEICRIILRMIDRDQSSRRRSRESERPPRALAAENHAGSCSAYAISSIVFDRHAWPAVMRAIAGSSL